MVVVYEEGDDERGMRERAGQTVLNNFRNTTTVYIVPVFINNPQKVTKQMNSLKKSKIKINFSKNLSIYNQTRLLA